MTLYAPLYALILAYTLYAITNPVRTSESERGLTCTHPCTPCTHHPLYVLPPPIGRGNTTEMHIPTFVWSMIMAFKSCAECGEPSEKSHCEEHQPRRGPHNRTDTTRWSWIQLSRRARRLQPYCLLCASPDDLQLDHSPRAWARDLAGKPIRLEDCSVLCRWCNVAAGSSKPGSDRYREWELDDGDLNAVTPDRTLGAGGTQMPAHLRGNSESGSVMGITLKKEEAWQG